MAYLQDYRVLRYDGRGQGASPKPEGPYRLELLLADLVALLDRLQWPPSAVAGISNGGCVALGLASRHPERVTHLAAADTYAQVTPLLHHKIRSWLVAHQVGGPEHRFDVALPWIWGESMLEANPEMVDFYRQRAASLDDHVVRALLEGALTHDVDLSRISCPVLLAAGEEDLLTTPTMMRAMAAQLKDARFLPVPGGHASLLEYPQIWPETLLPFLNQGGHDVV